MGGQLWVLGALLALLGGHATVATDCEDSRVQISAISGDRRSYYVQPNFNAIHVSYGDTVHVFCSANSAANLNITMGNWDTSETFLLQPTVVNVTTLVLTLEKHVIARYDISCADVVTDCVVYLAVQVDPILTVLSPNVHQKKIIKKKTLDINKKQYEFSYHVDYYIYFVPITEDYELVCSGHQSDSLHIHRGVTENVMIETYVANDITIKSVKLHETQSDNYVCDCIHMSDNYTIQVFIEVYVDYPPAVTNFWCIEEDWLVNCTWNVTSLIASYTLIYVDEGIEERLCENTLLRKTNRFCAWNARDLVLRRLFVPDDIRFNFVLEACNLFFCVNQTFHIERNATLKPYKPEVTLSNIGPKTVILAWNSTTTLSYIDTFSFESEVEYKLTYWMSEMQPKELDLSTLRGNCSKKNEMCEKELKLPCPGTFYEVKVYAKLATTPQNDVYWSDPAKITFSTDSQLNDVVEPMCSKNMELIINKESGVYATKLLGRDIENPVKRLHKKIYGLRDKLAVYEKLKRQVDTEP